MITPENPMRFLLLMQWKLKESWSTVTSCYCLTVGLVFSSDWWVHAMLPRHKKEVCLPYDSFPPVTHYEVFNMLDAANGVGELGSLWWVWLDLEGKNGALSWPPLTAMFVCWGLNPSVKCSGTVGFLTPCSVTQWLEVFLECGKRGTMCLHVSQGVVRLLHPGK